MTAPEFDVYADNLVDEANAYVAKWNNWIANRGW